MDGGRLWDFKLGRFTAEKFELIRNHKKSEQEASDKVLKMAKYDFSSESALDGVRDSDVFCDKLPEGHQSVVLM